MKGFQVGILIFFGVFVFLGVLIFSGAIKLGGSKDATPGVAEIVIWGTAPRRALNKSIEVINSANKGVLLAYVEKDPREYESDLLHAFAFGGLPDIFLFSQDLIYTYKDKVLNIPFSYFPERTFSDTYVRAADIFKDGAGFLGFPIFSDPLVMYYNQDLLEAAGFTTPPAYWSDMFTYVPKLTKKNEALQIETAGIALGEFSNVRNAKEIFMALLLQLNNSVIVKDTDGQYQSTLNSASNVSSRPAVQSLKFFNEFSDPLKPVYSWNKAQTDSQAAFVSGDLALYFGLASEFANIKAKNPNLHFDVASLPQVKELDSVVTYGDVYAFSIPKNSPNAQTALSVAAALANGPDAATLVGPSGFMPVRRDLLSGQKTTRYTSVLYAAALNARSWIDLDALSTNAIFADMVEHVSSGLSSPEDAVTDANTEFKKILSGR